MGTDHSNLEHDIITIFGLSDINLKQADLKQQAIIDVTTIFGGMTLVIPADWQLKSIVLCLNCVSFCLKDSSSYKQEILA